MSIGKRLTLERKKTGLNQTDFAEKLGLRLTAYKNYETDTRKIPVPVLISLIEQYGIDVHWLLTGKPKELSTDAMDVLEGMLEGAIELSEKNPDKLPKDRIPRFIVGLYTLYLHKGYFTQEDFQYVMRLVK